MWAPLLPCSQMGRLTVQHETPLQLSPFAKLTHNSSFSVYNFHPPSTHSHECTKSLSYCSFPQKQLSKQPTCNNKSPCVHKGGNKPSRRKLLLIFQFLGNHLKAVACPASAGRHCHFRPCLFSLPRRTGLTVPLVKLCREKSKGAELRPNTAVPLEAQLPSPSMGAGSTQEELEICHAEQTGVFCPAFHLQPLRQITGEKLM